MKNLEIEQENNPVDEGTKPRIEGNPDETDASDFDEASIARRIKLKVDAPKPYIFKKRRNAAGEVISGDDEEN